MRSTRASALAWFFAAACLLGAAQVVLAEHAFPNAFTGPDNVVLLLAAAALIAAGILASASPRCSAALVTGGAVMGGIGLVWTVIAPFLAVVLIVLCVMDTRCSTETTRRG